MHVCAGPQQRFRRPVRTEAERRHRSTGEAAAPRGGPPPLGAAAAAGVPERYGGSAGRGEGGSGFAAGFRAGGSNRSNHRPGEASVQAGAIVAIIGQGKAGDAGLQPASSRFRPIHVITAINHQFMRAIQAWGEGSVGKRCV